MIINGHLLALYVPKRITHCRNIWMLSLKTCLFANISVHFSSHLSSFNMEESNIKEAMPLNIEVCLGALIQQIYKFLTI